ncbi:UNVERIFIED_CONTAM: hypothetical protein H355_003730 [Colinus virginianus]|nr:hypothetical protein H355_003730 [Colinus virginianus]
MPENAGPKAHGGAGNRAKGTYQDRDKPSQIRFSNISAGKGIHPTIISESFQKALEKGIEVLTNMAQPVELSDRETLLNSATTSLNSKVVCQYSSLLSPMSVDAVMKVIDPSTASSVDLRDIKIVKKLGGTIDDCELVEGLVLTQKVANTGVTRVEKAKIGLIQFCLSAPKTDMDNQIVVSDYAQMDRVLREERAYILNLVKQIKKAGCNVLLIQKSILRDALSDLALHFLNKMKIMVVKDIEREDIEFICKTIGTKPVAHIDQFTPDMLGSAELAEEVNLNGSGKLIKVTGCTNPGKTVTIVVRGSNKLVLEEAERSIHDALCVIRCLVKKRALIAGGGAPEIELALRLNEYARTLRGMDSYCVRAYGDALEVIPSTLAENAGLNPISTVTELRNRHAQGEKTAGINVRKGGISNILEELVVQPLLVSVSALTLATETVRSILKIDDVGELGAAREQPLTTSTDCSTQTDFSKLGTSNQEYYLKLEELKNAHLETMAKLESMYRNKLYLKGAQLLERNSADSATSNVCCRPTWEKHSHQPLNLHKSFSDSSISDPLGSGTSGGSDRELASEESCSKTGSSLSAKERIAKMWDGFSVEDYVPCRKHSPPSTLAARTARKQKAWSPKVTVPKPFQMTIREAKRREQNVKSKSQIEMENNLLKKQLEEEAECQKKFRANPVPATVFLPLYHEIVQRNEERRKSVKERSKLRLLASQKPFKFIEREKQRDELRKMQLRDLSAPEKKTKPFKAKPVPRCVYSPSVRDKLQEEELYREIRIRMRAEELLRNASLPSSRLASKDTSKKKHKSVELNETERKPKIQPSVPDFDRLHQKFQKRLRQKQQVKHLTVCEPFHLRTPYIRSNKGKVLRDIQEDEERLKETRWPYTSPRRRPKNRRSHSPLSGSGEPKSPKVTQSSQRRLQALRFIKDKVKEVEFFEEAASISPQSEQSFEEEKRKGIRSPSWDGESTEKEEETRASPHAQHPHCAGEAGSSPTSDQHHEEEEQKEEKEEEEAKAGLPLGHSLEEENGEEEDGSRPSSQSDQSHEHQEESQSDPEAEDAFQYEDEEYESDDSEEKPSDEEAD